MATHPEAAGLQCEGGAARIVLLGEDDDAHARLPRTDARDERDAVDEPVLVALLDRYGRTGAGQIAAQVGVDEQHVESAALRGRPLQAAQRGRAAAGGGHVDVGLGGQGGGERLGEDAVVVDDQDTDANH